MTSDSSLIIEQQQDISIVKFAQPTLLDTFHITKVSQELFDLVEKKNITKIVLDLASIKMISSQALGALLSLQKKLSENNGKFVIAGIDPRLYRVFKITSLQEVFAFSDDVESALQLFNES
ncbi:MAG: STAS domain-containing protein [Sedimentisphaerales bacterium]|nr:STAS domain-containing protein [Sedimentisphaerales bacterium]